MAITAGQPKTVQSLPPLFLGESHEGSRTLVAVLLNPPTGSGARTMTRVEMAAQIIGCQQVSLVNLFPRPTKDTAELIALPHSETEWISQRRPIADAIRQSHEVLVAWGKPSLPGAARESQRNQIDWVWTLLGEQGRTAWSVGPDARHPSRWHQYLSDRHGRTSGGSLEMRIAEGLQRIEPHPKLGSG